MNKAHLQHFISKYNLNGEIEAAVWSIGQTLHTKCVSSDNTVVGEVVCKRKEFDFDKEHHLGIYDTKILSKMLDVLGGDVNLTIKNGNGRITTMTMRDESSEVNYQLADTGIIRKPSAKSLPSDEEYDLEIIIDDDVLGRFVKAKSAFDDVPDFDITTPKENQCVITVGYKKEGMHRITLDVTAKGFLPESMSFRAKPLREIIVANKDFDTASIRVHKGGLMKISFDNEFFQSTYYMFPNTPTE